ncbi:MAG: lysine 2,3-aminomutase [Acidimicrobiia bacterium]|nr:lysine 2,3-aminomutase [Acidimicrobiia bacterium]MYC57531.1 lysine 2,3-aminomutase [Acidimicrobiia bacterium]MYI30105.1 lysine 2,3-aminomutase [Acidimicrobiia bacterium]
MFKLRNITSNNESQAFRTFQLRNLEDVPGFERMSAHQRMVTRVVGSVLPFKTNNYVCEQLIDWDNVPNDPMFQLTFPQEGMLDPENFTRIADLIKADASSADIKAAAQEIQLSLNPHPAGQVEMNAGYLEEEVMQGLQHKYRETVLFFPTQGQTCHAYCTYCFRWPQFVRIDDLKFASKEIDRLVSYLKLHPTVSDVLFTGGDPMIMRTDLIRRYVEPLLDDALEIDTIRFGTKAPAYWPYMFTNGQEADDLLRLFEEIVASGRHLAIMAHYSHPVELSTEVSQEALRRIVNTGAVVRCQAPLIRHVNDSASTWADMITTEVKLGAVPYYMFVERDTGARRYFEVPLVEAYQIYTDAYKQVSGLARTWRGPSMSATPGKVMVDGIAEIGGEKVIALKFVQARNPEWVNKLFFAAYDEKASWLDELRPAFGKEKFFYTDELNNMKIDTAQRVQLITTRAS